MLPDLIDLTYLLNAINTAPGDLEPEDEAKFEAAITAASEAIRNFTDRTFEISTGLATERTFQYDGSGIIDIDDVQSVTSVTFDYGPTSRVLDTIEFDLQPYNRPIRYWLNVITDAHNYPSPAMGFTNNLDTIGYRANVHPIIARIVGTWGWDAIPAPIKQAAVWTSLAFTEAPQPYVAEAIDSYSRSFGRNPSEEAIPARAQTLLIPYIAQKV